MKKWNRIKARFEQVKAEYGKIALVTYLVLWAAVLIAYAVAIKMGVEMETASSKGGILVGAWVAAKVSQPFRIVLTIVLTPFIASLVRRPPVLGEQ